MSQGSPTFSPDTVLAASGPLVHVRLGADSLPCGAVAAARVAAPPRALWSVIEDVAGYTQRVPMIHRVHQHGDRVTVSLRFKVSLFSTGFEFVADVKRDAERRLDIVGVSGEPHGLKLGFVLEPLAGGAETLLETHAEFDIHSLGWLVKYFLKGHPKIQFGVFPGVALSLLDAMRRGVAAR
jgi:ribosome-associated toxin RatA of RatAB toxin-antitoxin module